MSCLKPKKLVFGKMNVLFEWPLIKVAQKHSNIKTMRQENKKNWMKYVIRPDKKWKSLTGTSNKPTWICWRHVTPAKRSAILRMRETKSKKQKEEEQKSKREVKR